MVDMLKEQGCEHIRVVVGGGGTILPDEIEMLEKYGVEKIYTPEDGRRMGLLPMIEDVLKRVAAASKPRYEFGPAARSRSPAHCHDDHRARRRRQRGETGAELNKIRRALGRTKHQIPVIGITGTGGAGKSSLSDELLARFVRHFPGSQIAVVAIDPTRRRSGGALLGDRIRMNSLANEQIFMRSLATRRQHLATSAVLKDVIELYQLAGFDLIFVETAGIGQSDTEIVDCGGSVAVRHDQRVRRGQSAREDRHARLRRHGRAQQVREARRRGQPAPRAQAVAAQSSRAHADSGQ
jgi:methylmalonyl-CoA mutase